MVQELASLVDPSVPVGTITLPAGHPFTNVVDFIYWIATTSARFTDAAWDVGFAGNFDRTQQTNIFGQAAGFHVWCVRGGRGVDSQ
jgi:hypothetical protein